jgi:MerR family transcriptional regulator, light-induced transcriptional regulator
LLFEKTKQVVACPVSVVANQDLTTAQLAERTGVPAGTLRVWESRHGFPSPIRLPGGHRRYTDRDVELVREVAGLREQGLSMAGAIARVNRIRTSPASIFAGLREAHPETQTTVISKPVLLGITRAIEDEYCARASSGLLIGSFQRERFYRQTERRWSEIARGAVLAVALADFPRLQDPLDGVVEVPIGTDQPLAREWTLIVDAPASQACLAGWELASPDSIPDARRRFEVLWSFDPAVVRSASEIGLAALERAAPGIAARVPETILGPVSPPAVALQVGAALSHRIVGYLAAMLES